VSRLTSIARCGTSYELERVKRLPSSPAGWTMQGIAIHDAADAWEKSARTMGVLDAQDVFKRSWRAEMAKAESKFPERDRWLVGGRKKVQNDLVDRYNNGLAQVECYIRYNQEDANLVPYTMPDGSIAAEIGFEIEFDGVTVLGYLDLLMEDTRTGELLVRDIKSGSKAPVVPFQLIVYRMAVADVLGLDVRWGHFFMTREGHPGQAIDLTTLDEDLIRLWFRRQVEIAERGLFLPNPGDACRTCGVSIHCPLMGRR
jgi:putative RecB family exonuclease